MQMNFSRNGSDHHEAAKVLTPPKQPDKPRYKLTSDPVFYTMVAFFAFLTTGLPALLGQPNFMPIIQAVGLTVFTAIPLRAGERRHAFVVMLLWLVVQVAVIYLLASILPVQTARSIPDGFDYRNELVTWAYAGDLLPRSLAAAPLGRALEVVGVVVGSLVSGGLVGGWFLVRGVDLFGFSAATLTTQVIPGGLVMGLMPWRLLTLCGYAGLFLLLAQPILTNRWDIGHYIKEQRNLLLVSIILLVAGLALEVLLPGLWQRLLTPG